MKRLILYHFKRDLRLHDNAGFYHALKEARDSRQHGDQAQVLPLFVFDRSILEKLSSPNDRRVSFIYHKVTELKNKLRSWGGDLLVLHGKSVEEIQQYCNHNQHIYDQIDYYGNFDDDPYPLKRDAELKKFFTLKGSEFHLFKDHLIFARREILTQAQKPYTVFTPYKKQWREKLNDPFYLKSFPNEKYKSFLKPGPFPERLPTLRELGFQTTNVQRYLEFQFDVSLINTYAEKRDFPALAATSFAGVHLRFGTISPRELVAFAIDKSEVFVSELAWRDFFAQILFHYPHVVKTSYREAFEKVPWRKDATEFVRWTEGTTGYPLVDAGMRELQATGYMHNRVRMVTASFLCKHLLHHWHQGERWFASLLMDYDLASNNGNWQWSAGTGCDAAPYFRIFNPTTQQKRFDSQFHYIKKWIPEFGTTRYPQPIVEHEWARKRALQFFKDNLN